MGSFFKKVGIGAAIGLAFGLMAALSFIGITKVVNTFFLKGTGIRKIRSGDGRDKRV